MAACDLGHLLNLIDPQSALLTAVLSCAYTESLTRCVAPPVLHQASYIHDQLSRGTFAAILGLSALDELTWKQASLKIKLRGFGIINLTQISAAAAFVGSWCYSMSMIPRRFPSRIDLCDSINCACPSPFHQHLCKAIASLPSTLGSDGETLIPQSLSGLMANPVKLQNCLSSDITEGNAAICVMQPSPVKHAVRIRSCQGRGAGSWLQALPSAPKFVLKSSEFRVAAFLRLGIPFPYSQFVTKCDYGTSLDEHGYHLLTCKFDGGPVWQHNTIVLIWAKRLDELNIPHQVEPRNRYTDSENRLDITTYDPTGHLTKDLDISLAHPHSCNTVQKAAKISGFAAELREKRKMTKYGQQQFKAGSDTTCIPLVFEHFGFWGHMLKTISIRSPKFQKMQMERSETDQSCLSAILMIFCMIKTFNILFIDCYCYAYIKLAIVIGRVRVQI